MSEGPEGRGDDHADGEGSRVHSSDKGEMEFGDGADHFQSLLQLVVHLTNNESNQIMSSWTITSSNKYYDKFPYADLTHDRHSWPSRFDRTP